MNKHCKHICRVYSWNLEKQFLYFLKPFLSFNWDDEKFFVLYWCLCVSVCFSHLSFQKWKMIEWTLPYSPYCIFLHIYFLKMSAENTGISETINWKIFSGSKPPQPLTWSAFGSLTFLRVHKPSKPCTYSVGYHYYHSHEGKKSHEQWQGCLTI